MRNREEFKALIAQKQARYEDARKKRHRMLRAVLVSCTMCVLLCCTVLFTPLSQELMRPEGGPENMGTASGNAGASGA